MAEQRSLQVLSNFSFWQGDGYFSVLSPPVLRLKMKTIYKLFNLIFSIKDFKTLKKYSNSLCGGMDYENNLDQIKYQIQRQY